MRRIEREGEELRGPEGLRVLEEVEEGVLSLLTSSTGSNEGDER